MCEGKGGRDANGRGVCLWVCIHVLTMANLKLKFQIGHGQNVFHLTPLEQICPLNKF